MKKSYLFPGQGSQFVGMAKDLFEKSDLAKKMFAQANEILGFDIQKIMSEGPEEKLRQTQVTQPAIFIHSVILAKALALKPDMVAGHSLGEFSALVANETLAYEDALRLVSIRANAMQKACDAQASTMAAVLGLDDAMVEKICKEIDDIVVPANYNSPAQLVISGTKSGIASAIQKLSEAGAKRAIELNVSGAFHSPLMESAKKELEEGILKTNFRQPVCPIYQNATAKAETDKEKIKENLIRQLTAPVLWTQTIQNMSNDGATSFIEIGPGKVLQGLVRRIIKTAEISGVETI